MNTIFKYIIFPVLITFIISFIIKYYFISYIDIETWSNFIISKAGETKEFCEFHGMDKIIRQPSNAWSNVSFIFFGIIYLVYAYDDFKSVKNIKSNFIIKYFSFSILLGMCMIFLGLSSFLFHASLIQFSSRLDITGVVMSCLIVFSYSILRLISIKNYRKTKVFFLQTYRIFYVAIVFVSILFFSINMLGREITIFLIASTIILNSYIQIKYRPEINFKYFIISIIIILISMILWVLDKELICNPTSILQLHAVWHILTSVSVYLMYLFYRSEILFSYNIPIK